MKINNIALTIIATSIALANLISCKEENGEIFNKQINGKIDTDDTKCKYDYIELEEFNPFRKYALQIHVPFGGELETTWVKSKTHDGKIIDSAYSVFKNEDRLKVLATYIENGKTDSFDGVYLDAETWRISYCSKTKQRKFEINEYIIQNRGNCTKESLHFNEQIVSMLQKIEIGTRKNKDIIHEAMSNALSQLNSNGYKKY